MYGKDYDHENGEGPLYARHKDIISNTPILHKGMMISIDEAVLEIETIRLDLDYDDEYNSTIDITEEIEVHVYMKFDPFMAFLCEKKEGLNGWRDINF